MSGVTVEAVGGVDDELVDAFATLIPQLSSSSPPPGRTELERIVHADACTVFVARDGAGRIVGALTLAVFPIPTGVRAWIEDVVVDQSAGRSGAGTALTRAALEAARTAGAKTVELTSRPSREAANALYQKLGFTPRDTNVWRMTLEA